MSDLISSSSGIAAQSVISLCTICILGQENGYLTKNLHFICVR